MPHIESMIIIWKEVAFTEFLTSVSGVFIGMTIKTGPSGSMGVNCTSLRG